MKSMSASAFKAHCLSVMDDVARTGEPVAITKRGRTVANIVRPHAASRTRYPQQGLRGSGRTHGDIVSPSLPAEVWDVLAEGS